VTWTDGAGNNRWEIGANWSSGKTPGAGDDVFIPAGVVVIHATGMDSVRSLSSLGTLLEITGGTLSVLGPGGSGSVGATPPSRIADLALIGGTLRNTTNLTVTDTFTWEGGTLAGSGQLTVVGSLDLSGPGDDVLDGQTLRNAGQAVWSQGPVDVGQHGGTFLNEVGATFEVQTANRFAPAFSNAGTLILEPAAGTATFASFSNSGKVLLESGTLQAGAYSQSAGVTRLQGGELDGTGATSLVDIEGGVLLGSGEIGANVHNSNAIALTGTLRVLGNYSQDPNTLLQVLVAGAAPTHQFARLLVRGQAGLGGVLKVQFLPPFTPRPGDSFPLLVAGSTSGHFRAVTSLSPTPGVRLSAAYANTGLTVNAQATAKRPAPGTGLNANLVASLVEAGLETTTSALEASLAQPALATSGSLLLLLDAARPAPAATAGPVLPVGFFSGVAGESATGPGPARATGPGSAGVEEPQARASLIRALGRELAEAAPPPPLTLLAEPGALSSADFAAALLTGAMATETRLRPQTDEEKRLLELLIPPVPAAPAAPAPPAGGAVPADRAAPAVRGHAEAPAAPAAGLWARAALAGAALLGWALPALSRRRARGRPVPPGSRRRGVRPPDCGPA
jgi:hypothetical protein